MRGNPKIWYCIDPSDHNRINDLMPTLYNDFEICGQFMQHKICIFDPLIVLKHGINVYFIDTKNKNK